MGNPPRNALPGTLYSQHSDPEAAQALHLLAGGQKQLLQQLGLTECLKLEGTCKDQIPLLAHLLWGSCSIPTCSTVRTANKRLKATQIQGTSLSNSQQPTASVPMARAEPTQTRTHIIPGSAADSLKSPAFLLHLLPCTFTWCYYINTSLGGARISQCLLAFSC